MTRPRIDTRQRLPITQAGKNDFVFMAAEVGVTTLTLQVEEPATGNRLAADSVKVTVKDPLELWTLANCRGNPSVNYNYFIEDRSEGETTVVIQRFPDPELTGGRVAERRKHLVFIHGYNVNLEQARAGFSELYKRLFWLGFRGNFIGVTWYGDQGTGLSFDDDVENALQTSPGLMLFLKDTVRPWADDNPDNVEVMAHSLGALVMYDALRLYEATRTDSQPLVHNAIDFEAAVWREEFERLGTLDYRLEGGQYSAETADDEITYDTGQMRKQSWLGWFNQAEHSVNEVLTGGIYHSYVPQDRILETWMRANDHLHRGVLGYMLHYVRSKLEDRYRGPLDSAGLNSLAWRVPALMDVRKKSDFWPPHYGTEDVNLPRGCVESTQLDAISTPATTLNWREKAHSDWCDVVNHRDLKERQWFPKIYKWYKVFLGEGTNPSALPIGKEF